MPLLWHHQKHQPNWAYYVVLDHLYSLWFYKWCAVGLKPNTHRMAANPIPNQKRMQYYRNQIKCLNCLYVSDVQWDQEFHLRFPSWSLYDKITELPTLY